MVFKLKAWDWRVSLPYGPCVWKIKLKKWFSGILRCAFCELSPIVLLVDWGWGPEKRCFLICQPIGLICLLSMWDAKVKFWKEAQCFNVRLVEIAEAEGSIVRQFRVQASKQVSQTRTWWEKVCMLLFLASPSSSKGWGREWPCGGWSWLAANGMGVSLTSKEGEGACSWSKQGEGIYILELILCFLWWLFSSITLEHIFFKVSICWAINMD